MPYPQLVIGHQIGISTAKATARQPDLIVHSTGSLAAIFNDDKLLRAGLPAPLLVVEVVSSSTTDKQSYDRDYQEKATEYAMRGISEYWIVDPDRVVVKIGTLGDGTYQFQDFTGNQLIVSPTFSAMNLTAEQVLNAG